MSLDPSIRKFTKKNKLLKIQFINHKRFEKMVGRNKPFVKLLKQFESQLGLFVIVGFSIIMNLSIANAKSVENTTQINPIAGISPEALAETADTVNHYLPQIETTKDKIELAMAMQTDSEYIQTADNFDTNLTPEEPVPAPAQTQKRTKTVDYTVQAGDTISQIAARFGLTVATIKYSNDIANLDNLKIGQTVKIPSANLSQSALAKLQNKKLAYSRTTVGRDSSSTNNGSYIVPVNHYSMISQSFNRRHAGIDYATPVGTAVHSSAGGTVIEAKSFGWNYGWGKTVLVSHGNGITTRYGHLSQVYVSVGDYVGQGETVGLSGNTGHSTGPHLHFQKEKNGVPIFPY